ncbi:cysteine desulfurase family protein [Chengkuizengella axinellae]|uniref:Cysteine desulfurase family protein n=1 Tax=Chengkuizengella axinellae TaxID=3064388 RepID=A0ABT9IUS8_9BACL|nr:cysteine desulfurase family protein [Chengkuizengella sp. 2205SS18-9]MDP5273114.1 cysteine desulfurase family protein [Chengkuizengella sp. 2205SS18-9]
MYYFDHSATTPPFPEVTETVSEVMKNYYGNPSSLHQLGIDAENLIRTAKHVMAESLNIDSEQLIFTSGGTESNNLAIKGIAFQYQNRGKHLITTEIEHASVYESFKQLEKLGFKVTYLPVDHTGQVSIYDLQQAITDETILVSVMHVNNEVGTIQPIEEIANLLFKYKRIFFHVDAIQSIGKISIFPKQWNIDLVSISAHKLNGPKGVGVLYYRDGIKLFPLLSGGGQEGGYRSGTENVPQIVGMAKAVRISMDKQKKNEDHLYQLRKRTTDFIIQIPELKLNGSNDLYQMAPHIVHFSFTGMKSEVIIHALEKKGIYVSTRSACASGESKPSRVLEAMGASRSNANSGIRISMSADHSNNDIDMLCTQLEQVVQEYKGFRK